MGDGTYRWKRESEGSHLGFTSSRDLLRKLWLLFVPSLATRQNQPGEEEGKPFPNLPTAVSGAMPIVA